MGQSAAARPSAVGRPAGRAGAYLEDAGSQPADLGAWESPPANLPVPGTPTVNMENLEGFQSPPVNLEVSESPLVNLGCSSRTQPQRCRASSMALVIDRPKTVVKRIYAEHAKYPTSPVGCGENTHPHRLIGQPCPGRPIRRRPGRLGARVTGLSGPAGRPPGRDDPGAAGDGPPPPRRFSSGPPRAPRQVRPFPRTPAHSRTPACAAAADQGPIRAPADAWISGCGRPNNRSGDAPRPSRERPAVPTHAGAIAHTPPAPQRPIEVRQGAGGRLDFRLKTPG